MAVTDEDSRPVSEAVADKLRARGICADVAPTAAKFGKQIKFADKRGIPFVWFPAAVDEADNSGLIRLRTSVLVSKLRPTPPLGSAPSGICACR